MLPYKRSERVRKLLHRKICEIIREIKDPRIGFVTITDTELSDDLKELKVYYSVLGNEDDRKNTNLAINKACSFIKFRIGEELILRNVPNIMFVYDNSIERGDRVLSILSKISEEQGKNRNK